VLELRLLAPEKKRVRKPVPAEGASFDAFADGEEEETSPNTEAAQ
jgi:hypothetical protein